MKQIITLDGKDYALHTLKIKKEHFNLIEQGLKTSEVRINDRDFKAGELIYFVVIDDKKNKITHANGFYKITHVLKDLPEYFLKKIT